MTASPSAARGLAARLADGPVICAEGYLFELERRGYLQAGAFVPEVVLEHPERVTALHEEFVHAGSDVVEAFTYYTHREKLRVIGAVDLLEPLNREALALASRVAADTGTLLAGNICNTNVYDPADPASADRARAMFTDRSGGPRRPASTTSSVRPSASSARPSSHWRSSARRACPPSSR